MKICPWKIKVRKRTHRLTNRQTDAHNHITTPGQPGWLKPPAANSRRKYETQSTLINYTLLLHKLSECLTTSKQERSDTTFWMQPRNDLLTSAFLATSSKFLWPPRNRSRVKVSWVKAPFDVPLTGLSPSSRMIPRRPWRHRWARCHLSSGEQDVMTPKVNKVPFVVRGARRHEVTGEQGAIRVQGSKTSWRHRWARCHLSSGEQDVMTPQVSKVPLIQRYRFRRPVSSETVSIIFWQVTAQLVF